MCVHEQLHRLKCGLFFDKILSFGYYFTVYWQNITQVNIFKYFCAILYTFVVKYVTFWEPVHEVLSPDFVYISAVTRCYKLTSNIAHVGRPSTDICRLHKLTST